MALLVGDFSHCRLHDLARSHGLLVHLRLGRLPVVVDSSVDRAREVMVSSGLGPSSSAYDPSSASSSISSSRPPALRV